MHRQNANSGIKLVHCGHSVETGETVVISSCFYLQAINERPQIVQEYECGKAIPNTQILAKMEKALSKVAPCSKSVEMCIQSPNPFSFLWSCGGRARGHFFLSLKGCLEMPFRVCVAIQRVFFTEVFLLICHAIHSTYQAFENTINRLNGVHDADRISSPPQSRQHHAPFLRH